MITREQFYKEHQACPKCGNTELAQTLAGVIQRDDKDYVDNVNRAMCDTEFGGCGWSGKVIDLVPAGPKMINIPFTITDSGVVFDQAEPEMDLMVIAQKFLRLRNMANEFPPGLFDLEMEVLHALADEILDDMQISDQKEALRKVLVCMFLLGQTNKS
jgi:hypothetical protein